MKSFDLDKTDKIILTELQRERAAGRGELAAKARLSPSACHGG